jgi:hypothetical protein
VLNHLFPNTGIGEKFLITTWAFIGNGGAFYTGLDRSITKSSASSSACMTSAWLSDMDDLTQCIRILLADTTQWWNSKSNLADPSIFMYVDCWLLYTTFIPEQCDSYSGPASQTDLVYVFNPGIAWMSLVSELFLIVVTEKIHSVTPVSTRCLVGTRVASSFATTKPVV